MTGLHTQDDGHEILAWRSHLAEERLENCIRHMVSANLPSLAVCVQGLRQSPT